MKIKTGDRAELCEVFLLAYQEAGFERAIEAVAKAAIMHVGSPSERNTRAMIDLVAEHVGSHRGALWADTKEAAIVERRWLAMWLLRRAGMPWPQMSYPRIARLLHLRDHTTCIHGVRMVDRNERLLAEAIEIAERAAERAKEAA